MVEPQNLALLHDHKNKPLPDLTLDPVKRPTFLAKHWQQLPTMRPSVFSVSISSFMTVRFQIVAEGSTTSSSGTEGLS